jgi:hypothetical protein
MLTVLIAVGRFSVALAAILLIVTCTAWGWLYGSSLGFMYTVSAEASQPIGAIAGFLVGLLSAGSVFGLAAAVFDIQRTLRTMARNQGIIERPPPDYASTVPSGNRVEPRA